MSDDGWLSQLSFELEELRARGWLRALRAVAGCGPVIPDEGRRVVNLASNDYLGLSQHPRVIAASADAARELGAGSGASRVLSGNLHLHERVERRFAELKHAQAALLLPTGYMANLAVLTALAAPGDLVVMDKLCHASLIDAAFASGAGVRTYPHLNVARARELLGRAAGVSRGGRRGAARRAVRNPRRLLVTDSVFSMDGDVADLRALCEVAAEFSAILIVDEAHATGVLGSNGGGLAELQGVAGSVDVMVSTASKALGVLGGVVTARREVIDYVVNRGRPFIYSTAVPPAQAAGIEAALDVVRDEPWRRQRLDELSRLVRDALAERGWLAPLEIHQPPTPIIPLVLGSVTAAVEAAERLWRAGYWVPAIRPPTVARGASRLRISLRCDMEDRDVQGLLEAIDTCRELPGHFSRAGK